MQNVQCTVIILVLFEKEEKKQQYLLKSHFMSENDRHETIPADLLHNAS